eukprot:8491993-Ditylum_brightwellii.AAC.1
MANHQYCAGSIAAFSQLHVIVTTVYQWHSTNLSRVFDLAIDEFLIIVCADGLGGSSKVKKEFFEGQKN